MSDNKDLHVSPVPLIATAPVQAVKASAPVEAHAVQQPAVDQSRVAASTAGSLRPAYAQFVVDPDTNDVVLRIRDSTTDQVISETPSPEIQAISKYLNDYSATLARHRIANPHPTVQ